MIRRALMCAALVLWAGAAPAIDGDDYIAFTYGGARLTGIDLQEGGVSEGIRPILDFNATDFDLDTTSGTKGVLTLGSGVTKIGPTVDQASEFGLVVPTTSDWDFGAATIELPNGATLPSTPRTAFLFYETDVAADLRLKVWDGSAWDTYGRGDLYSGGRSGGQAWKCGTAAGDNCEIQPSTATGYTGIIEACPNQGDIGGSATKPCIDLWPDGITVGSVTSIYGVRFAGTYTQDVSYFLAPVSLFLNAGTFKTTGVATINPIYTYRDQHTVLNDTTTNLTGLTNYSFWSTNTYSTTSSGTLSSDDTTFFAGWTVTGANTTLTNVRGLQIANPTGTGNVTNLRGIDIAALTKGSTLNTAIRTLGGDHRLVGSVSLGADVTPNVQLDVTGAYATRRTGFTAANGANNNVSTSATSFIKVTGPTGAFSMTGLANPFDGKRVVVYNATAQNMTIAHESGSSTAANRIVTNTGADVATVATGSATLIYDSNQSRWVLVSVAS